MRAHEILCLYSSLRVSSKSSDIAVTTDAFVGMLSAITPEEARAVAAASRCLAPEDARHPSGEHDIRAYLKKLLDVAKAALHGIKVPAASRSLRRVYLGF